LLGLAAIGAGLWVFRALRQVPADALRQARDVAAAFRTGTVTTSFAAYASEAKGTSRLQFATLREVELFERKDEAAIFWGTFQLPDVIVEARAPVEYTYYVELQQPWSFTQEGQTVLVRAPRIEFNAPAVDASALRYEVKKGSILRDQAAVLEKLRLGLTELAKQRAREHVALIRDTGRRETEDFVETWLRSRFSDGGAFRARVTFADEAPAAKPAG
jgi:hypothetical protein